MHTTALRIDRIPTKEEMVAGPYRGEISVVVAKGEYRDDRGGLVTPRIITVSPRTYKDLEGGKYQAHCFRVDDIPVLIFALQKALEYCYENPVTGDGTHDSNIRQ